MLDDIPLALGIVVDQLQKELFEFAKSADHLNQALRSVPTEHSDIRTIFELQGYLSVIARKAEYVASVVGDK